MLFGYRSVMAVMRGVVTRLEAGRPHVEVADLGVGYAFGPCELATSDPIAKGDRVFVAQVGDTPEDIAVLGLVDPPATSSAPSGPASGDLSGTYPNPTVKPSAITAVGDPRYLQQSGADARYVQLTDPRLTDNRPPTVHSHGAGDISFGTFAIARIPTGTTSTTVALGNHNHVISNLTGTIAESQLLTRLSQASLDARYALAGAAPAAHTHPSTDLPADVLYRLVHGSTASTARPARFFVEWVGSVAPTNMGPNDTWVNTAL